MQVRNTSGQARAARGFMTSFTALLLLMGLSAPRALGADPPDTKRAATADDASQLRYRFEPGKRHAWQFELEATLGDATEKTSGMAFVTGQLYRPPSASVQNSVEADLSIEETDTVAPAGAALVVSRDGYLLTSEKLVRGAQTIEIRLQGRSMPARVVKADANADLALVKVEASGLNALPLAGKSAELGDEAYLLSGSASNATLSQGAIAGMLIKDRQKLLQFDKSFESSAWGTPIFNREGHVLGIASGRFSSNSSAGLIVGLASIRAFLAGQQVELAKPEPAGADGPNVNRALRSVAVVAAGATAAAKPAETFRVLVISSYQQQSPDVPSGFRRSYGSQNLHTTNELEINERGEAKAVDRPHYASSESQQQLPYLLGSPAMLVFERLPEGRQTDWTVEQDTSINLQGTIEVTDRDWSRRITRLPSYRYGLARREVQTTVAAIPATELTRYQLVNVSGNMIRFKKHYELHTKADSGKSPKIELVGDGGVEIDGRAKLPNRMKMKYQITLTHPNMTLRIPLIAKYNPVDLVKLEEQAKKQQEASKKYMEEFNKKHPELARSSQPSIPDDLREAPEQKVDRIVKQLKEPKQGFERTSALMDLSRLKPIDAKRDAVAAAVRPLISDLDTTVRTYSIKALGAWGSKQDIPALLKMLDQLDSQTRGAAIEALGKLPDPRTAAALAKLAGNENERYQVMKALAEMGSAAEPELIKLLEHDEKMVRYEAAGALGDIGSAKAAAALRTRLSKETDNMARYRIEAGLRKIERQ